VSGSGYPVTTLFVCCPDFVACDVRERFGWIVEWDGNGGFWSVLSPDGVAAGIAQLPGTDGHQGKPSRPCAGFISGPHGSLL
jgi:hypothetical protein